MSCDKCNCKTAPCSCEDQGLTTPPPCSVNTAFCPEPSPCSEQFDSQCIIYNGQENVCAGITSGMNIQEVVSTLTTALNPFLCLQCPSVFLPTSGTVDVSLTPTLTWNSVIGATGYDIYFDTVSPPTTLLVSNITTTSYTIPAALTENTEYFWQVVSKNSDGDATNCPIEQFKTLTIPVPKCVNPLAYLINSAIATAKEINYDDLLESINSLLSEGLIINQCDLCCPDCEEPYVLGNTVNFINFYDYVGTRAPWACCLNVDSSLSAYSTFETETSETTWKKCCTDFSTCIGGYGPLFPNGIIEYNTINNNSTLCVIKDTLETITPALTPVQILSLIKEIVDVGVVVDCNEGQISISSISTYISYNPF